MIEQARAHNRAHRRRTSAAVLLAAVAAGWVGTAQAKPISYVGGTMIMQENDETGHTLSLDYTFSPRYAVGLYAKQQSGGKEYNTVGPQFNSLLKRWNLPDGQANIFNSSGVGVTRYHGENVAAAWTDILADYETRRVFASYEFNLMHSAGVETSAWQRSRVGVAPYRANYDDLSTWLMVQVDHHPTKDRSVVVTPLVRVFYQTTLAEFGVSNDKTVLFNIYQQF